MPISLDATEKCLKEIYLMSTWNASCKPKNLNHYDFALRFIDQMEEADWTVQNDWAHKQCLLLLLYGMPEDM